MSLKKSLYQEKMKVFVKSDACPRSHIYEKNGQTLIKKKDRKIHSKLLHSTLVSYIFFFLFFLFFIEIEQQIEQLNLKTE